MRLVAGVLLLVAGCATTPPAVVGTTRFIKPPGLRLPSGPRPIHYTLDLTPEPRNGILRGVETIDVELSQTTRVLWLNARGVAIAHAEWLRDDRVVPLAPIRGRHAEMIGLSSGIPIGPGRIRLQIAFRSFLTHNGSEGAFSRSINGRWYSFTQFEPDWARRVIPCFDEPALKARWQITLHVGRDETAVSNTPMLYEVDEPQNQKRVTFAETPPLPSYLVAFAVGPFDIVDAGESGDTLVRVLVPHGQRAAAAKMAALAPRLLPLFEAFTNIPYPFTKLDVVTVPDFRGAMENPGLITVEQAILYGPDDKLRTEVIAHELAHQWFGNYVTLAWWDDVWLNESLATWLSTKILEQFAPGAGVGRLSDAAQVMTGDDSSSRALCAPILAEDAISPAFKGFLYDKGAAIVAMFESWVGEQAIQRGMRAYLRAHAWKNATTGDLIAALQHETTLPVSATLSTFLHQSGAPLLSVALTCEPARAPTVQVTQEPYREVWSIAAVEQTWSFPVCVSWTAGQAHGTDCALLDGHARSIELRAPSCPSLVLLGKNAARYYRSLYSPSLLEGQRRAWADLSAADRFYLVSDLQALLVAGRLAPSTVLPFLPLLVKDGDVAQTELAASVALSIGERFIPSSARKSWAAFVRETVGSRASREAPWRSDRSALRDMALATEGEEPSLVAEARRRLADWLSGTKDPMVSYFVRAATETGDETLFRSVFDKLGRTKDSYDRKVLLVGMGRFRAPELEKQALELVSNPGLSNWEANRLIWEITDGGRLREETQRFLEQNEKSLAARLPPDGYRQLMQSLKAWREMRAADEPRLLELLRPYAR